MFNLKNGWSKDRMIEAIKLGNNGKKALYPNTHSCAYRGQDSNKCAAGCFIPDSLYKRELEGLTINQVMTNNPEISKIMPLNASGMFYLQMEHDKVSPDTNVHDVLINWIKSNVV